MMRLRVRACLATSCAVVLGLSSAGRVGAHAPAPAQAQATFRVATDLVTVPVFVRASDAFVGGLRAGDFLLTDNGVPQKIESVESEAIPADVTILVETSSAMADYMSTINEQLQKIIAMVRPTDRYEVIGIGTYVRQILPMRVAADQPPVGRLESEGLTAVNDALVAALLRQPDDTRRHLVIALSDTVDSISDTTLGTVREAARRSTSTLEVAWITMADNLGSWTTSAERARGVACGLAKRCEPRSRYFMPHISPRPGRPFAAFDQLRDAAELSGGEMHPPGVFVDRSASVIFDKLYKDYRRAYILRYTPTGVSRDGWHEIAVTVPKYSSYEIRARRGYLVEAPRPVAAPPSAKPGSIDALIEAGLRSDDAAIDRVIVDAGVWINVVKLIHDFKDPSLTWPGDTGREFLLALRLASNALRSTRPELHREGESLLKRYEDIARQTSPGLERAWMEAEVALVHASLSSTASSIVAEAVERFPKNAVAHLARAVTFDHQWRTGDAAVVGPPKPANVARLLELYASAERYDETRQESLVRAGFFLHRLGRHAEALAKLEQAGDAGDDVQVRYWRWLFLGQVLDALGRGPEAAQAFRSAMALAPGAQSSRIALMTSLARQGRIDEARLLAEAVQISGAVNDPWLDYWSGEARHLPAILNRLKAFR